MEVIPTSYAARNADGTLTLFRGCEPEKYKTEEGVAFRACDGCEVVYVVPKRQGDIFGRVMPGTCRMIGVVA